jgi:hypothetical protein
MARAWERQPAARSRPPAIAWPPIVHRLEKPTNAVALRARASRLLCTFQCSII